MDERKNSIRELEEKKRNDTEARNRLLEGLGETLFQRIGEDEPFLENAGNTPGGILVDYRRLQRDISESEGIIKTLEEDILRLKELEEEISTKEDDLSQAEKELMDIYIRLGQVLLMVPSEDEAMRAFKQQEEGLVAKIEDQEKKLQDLEEKEGGILAWLGKNAQMAVSKALLLKNKSALERVYRNMGEKALSPELAGQLSGEASGIARNADEFKMRLSSVSTELFALKEERRKLGDLFGADGPPSRRIQGLEKHIAHVNGEFPGVHLRIGSLACESDGRAALSTFLRDEDNLIIKEAGILTTKIAESDLGIEKIKAAINIDIEKVEIDKIRKVIANHKQRITAAEEAINDLEKQIEKSEERIKELDAFLQGNGNREGEKQEDHGRKSKKTGEVNEDSSGSAEERNPRESRGDEGAKDESDGSQGEKGAGEKRRSKKKGED